VLFVGGGVIALEFSHVYARAGAKVTILEVLPRLLPAMDADAVEQIRQESERLGIRMHTGVTVKRVEGANGGLRIVFEEGGKEHSVVSDRVVNGAGRTPNVEHLDLDAGNVAHDKGRIKVDEFLRSTSNPSVYACGDVLASPQLSPLATYEGQIVGHNIVQGPTRKPDYASVPACVYTVPALASVGLTEAAAKEKRLDVQVEVNDMAEWFSTRTYAETRAWAKVLVDKKTDRILGAHLVGHAGEELINIFGIAIAHGITASQIREFVFAYPSFSADIKYLV
jgi:glutathione reductase (NADPH)